jgi:formate dehydrogenase (coenzyme F420) beta subunit
MQYATLDTSDGLNQTLETLLGDLLDKGVVEAVMVPTRQSHKRVVMQSLIANRADLVDLDPFAPVVVTNAAKQVAALTNRPAGRPVAVVLRSCELRAVIELAKLHQSHLDDLLLIGLDCYGRYENNAYLALAAGDEHLSTTFLSQAAQGGSTAIEGVEISTACQICEYPVCDGVDLRLAVVGADPSNQVWVEALTDKGREGLAAVGLDLTEGAPDGRDKAVGTLVAQREAAKGQLFEEFNAQTDSVDGLQDALAGCINCYNCRVACPACYCRECVFVTDTFRHDGEQYMAWAEKQGLLKLPADTTFYHLTRMVHMSTLCVGCGQCSSACPNDLPIMELFRTVSEKTQIRFGYVPGQDLQEAQPMATFHDEELDEVTGQSK